MEGEKIMVSKLMKQKEKYQFSGWLQYFPIVFLSILVLSVGSFFSLVGFKLTANIFFVISAILFMISVIDVITVKYDIHPREKRPSRKDELNEFDLMLLRRTCRSFQSTKLSKSDYNELVGLAKKVSKDLEVGVSPICFEYVSDVLPVWPLVGASEFLVAIVPKAYERRNIIEVGIKLQEVVIHATRMGVGTCWIGPGADQNKLVAKLGKKFDSEKDHIICICAIGYKSNYKPLFLRLTSVMQHRKLKLSSLYYSDNQLKTPLKTNDEPYSIFERNFISCQHAPTAFNSQPVRAIGTTTVDQDTNHKHITLDFVTTKKSRYYGPVAAGIWCCNWKLGCKALGIEGSFSFEEEKMPNDDSSTPRYEISWKEKKIPQSRIN